MKKIMEIFFFCGMCGLVQMSRSLKFSQQSVDSDTVDSSDIMTELNSLKKALAILEDKMSNREQLESEILVNAQSFIPRMKVIPRTCDELSSLEPQLPSGEYYIDPDGYGRGYSPIVVYCNMKTGSTVISHNNENPVNVTQCRNPGCSSHSVSYKVNMKQIIALIDMSSRCRQQIQYECIHAPLQMDGINYGWWEDRHGHPHFYWVGSNHTKHTCQCGLLDDCVDSSIDCNCDSNYPERLTDRGYISDKQALPVTSLHFGLINENNSWARFLLGKLECSGRISHSGMPESCQDLWRIGHTLNGFYTVLQGDVMQTVYCDMTKLVEEGGFQKVINSTVGRNTVLNPFANGGRSSIYFFATSHEELKRAGVFVPYGVEYLNLGQGLNLSTGLFIAPKAGVYSFSFHSLANENRIETKVCLKHNSAIIACSWASGRSEALPLSAILTLSKGDRVGVYLEPGILYSSSNSYTRFSGFMLDNSR